MKTKTLVAISLVTAAFSSAPALAHHSFAMFDKTQEKVLEGTLYAVEWKNPHSWIWVAAKDKDGKSETLGFECGSPAILIREGYSKAQLKVGAKVQITYNPLRDGRGGGSLVKIKLS